MCIYIYIYVYIYIYTYFYIDVCIFTYVYTAIIPSVVLEEHNAREKIVDASDGMTRQKEHYREFDDLKFAHVNFEIHFHLLEVFAQASVSVCV